MRSLLRVLALCAAVSLCVCYDVFVPSNQANSFISRPRGNIHNRPRGVGQSLFSLRPTKSPAERRAETCEDYSPCRFYAYHHGYQQAFQRYFGARNQPTRPAVTRRY
ncbi:matrix Gla protein isoform X2 [Parambassis ranga]|uniref:Matrix Gla protein n=1 Tax=Parambassis ranga TaxID=210632 RepID=A0A6P7IKS6_9TELE|nr:matrix Gla protein-like isoform X2 [Parambassis ranga]XP_028268801.1 matrix Gla protein-like isoform X2 [Parambassis ranga]